MSALPLDARMSLHAPAPVPAPFAQCMPSLVLLGTGTVGSAFVARYRRLAAGGATLPRFAWLANTRDTQACGDDPPAALRKVASMPRADARSGAGIDSVTDALTAGDTVVDASASDLLAARHARWLARGIHVVTANKLGNGAGLERANAIARAQRDSGADYGDSATVGAGLPLLRSLRELVAGGDCITAIEGVLSGSLAWLLDRFDGTQPFSALVREACAAGYTEPDPRTDLGGEDVRRKLLILARAAGWPLESARVQVEPLLPAALAAASPGELDAKLGLLDAPMRRRHRLADRHGASLRFIATFEAGGPGGCRAGVGLHALAPGHPLVGGSGTDNRVAIRSCRYRVQPLLVQGPGAGAEVTAAALLDDVLRITRMRARP